MPIGIRQGRRRRPFDAQLAQRLACRPEVAGHDRHRVVEPDHVHHPGAAQGRGRIHRAHGTARDRAVNDRRSAQVRQSNIDPEHRRAVEEAELVGVRPARECGAGHPALVHLHLGRHRKTGRRVRQVGKARDARRGSVHDRPGLHSALGRRHLPARSGGLHQHRARGRAQLPQRGVVGPDAGAARGDVVVVRSQIGRAHGRLLERNPLRGHVELVRNDGREGRGRALAEVRDLVEQRDCARRVDHQPHRPVVDRRLRRRGSGSTAEDPRRTRQAGNPRRRDRTDESASTELHADAPRARASAIAAPMRA